MNRLRILAAAALIFAACRTEQLPGVSNDTSNPPQGIAAGTLAVQVNNAAKQLTLRNSTEFVVGYMVIDKEMMTVAMFPPCGATCKKVVQGQSVTLNYSDIAGYTSASTEARVLWWTYAPSADGRGAAQGAVNTVSVRLD